MRVAVSEQGYSSAVDELVVANQTSAHVVRTLADRLRGSGGMAGDDHTATEFAASYDEAAAASLDALESLVGAFGSLARLTEASLTNHARADADATLPAWARAVVGPRTAADGAVGVVVGSPPSSLGSDAAGPGGAVGVVLDHLADVFWPNADTERLRAVGTSWREAAGSVDLLVADCDRAGSHLAHERSPEVPLALASLDQLRAHLTDLAARLTGLGDACSDYADQVDAKREELRSLLEDVAWELGITAGLGLVLGLASGGAAAGLAGGAAGARLAAAGTKARGILESLRLLAAGPALRVRSAGTTAREVRTFTDKVNGARVMLTGSHGRVASTAGRKLGEWRPGWLASHERGSSHTIARHVGKSDEFLTDRLVNNPRLPFASTFRDQAAAERWVERVMASQRPAIDRWLRSAQSRGTFTDNFADVTGRSIARDGRVLEARRVRVALQRDPSMPEGFKVLTAFPEP